MIKTAAILTLVGAAALSWFGFQWPSRVVSPPVPKATTSPAAKTPAFTLGAGDYRFTLVHQKLKREYVVHVPKSYQPKQKSAVILNFHGGGGNAANQIAQSQMNTAADQDGYIVVYPEGTGKTLLGKLFGTWNAGRCCGYAVENKIDDVGFVRALLVDLEQKFNVDKNRIYATGHSNGALMSYRLACELSDKIAAIAPNSAQDAFDNCQPSRPVPVLHFHGTADPAALYEGGQCGGRLAGDAGWRCQSVPAYNQAWATLNGCTPETKTFYQKGAATCVTHLTCRAGAEVALCTIEGAGHTWPGGQYAGFGERAVGKLSQDLSANDLMWAFFQKHPLK